MNKRLEYTLKQIPEIIKQVPKTGKRIFLAGVAASLIGCATPYFGTRAGMVTEFGEKKPDYTPSGFVAGKRLGEEKRQECPPSGFVGIFIGGLNLKGLGIEADLDYFQSKRDIETRNLWSRVNFVANPFLGAKVEPYLFGGVNFLREYGDRKNASFGVDIGEGIVLFDVIDARLTYTVFLKNENAMGAVTVSSAIRTP